MMNCTPWTTTLTPAPRWLMAPTAWSGKDRFAQLRTLAAGFAPISLEEMNAVALLNRVDTKFVLTSGQLLEALAHLQADYWMLEVAGQRLNHYRTLYFDTPGFDLYHAHVNNRAERYKVRCREYADTQLSFLEVKHHTRKDRTIKERIRTAQPVDALDERLETWLEGVSPLDADRLEPKLRNTFTRMTLVSRQYCERVTLDVDLVFSTDDRCVQLDGLVIAEVKMDAARGASPFLARMSAQKISRRGFSKYAMGVGMLYDGVKKNALKPKMLRIEKMMKGLASYE